MASMQQIEKAAADLGKMIAGHESAKRLTAAQKALEEDAQAQRLLSDYQRQVRTIQEKQQTGRPIEVEDKRRLEQVQDQVARHPLIGQLQVAEMDYLDLLRRVNELVMEQASTEPSAKA